MIAIETVAANTLRIKELPIPEPGAGEVVIRMLAAGICAGDMQIFHGKHKYVTFPIIQGHEGIGVIHSLGNGVDGLNAGERVCLQQQLACGTCYACRRGLHNICLNMKGLIGTQVSGLFSQFVKYPAWNAVKVPAAFAIDKGALVEPASVGENSARVSGIGPGERAVIIGAGAIGSFVAQACLARGAADVLIADIADIKLEAAKRNGIRHAVNAAKVDLKLAAAEAFGGEPVDVVFDCAGVEATLKQAIAVAGNGCRVVIVASFKEPVTLEIPSFQRREIAIHSVMGTTKASTRDAIAHLHSGALTFNGLITNRFPLERMPEAYQFIDGHPDITMKVLIDIGEE